MYYTPTIAPSGIVFYTGARYPAWKNNLFVGSLGGQQLRRLETSGDKVTHQEVVFNQFGRVHDVIIGPDAFDHVFRGAALEDHRLDPLQMQQLTEHQAGRAAAYDADLGAVWNGGFGHAVFRRDCTSKRSVTRTPNGDVSAGAGPHT